DCMMVSREDSHPLYVVSRDFSSPGLAWGHVPPHPSLFFHRSYFERYGLYDVNYRVAMDLELLARGITQERIVHVACLVTKMRQGGVSARNWSLRMRETTRALAEHGLINPVLGAWRLRWYYAIRSLVRTLLTYARIRRDRRRRAVV